MKTEAVVLRTHGGPEVLTREAVEISAPKAKEVRVAIRAVALNHLDLWVRRGLPNLKLEYPHRLGSDIVGVVDEVGAEVSSWKAGDAVVVAPGRSCGVCEACALGKDNLCPRYEIFGENTNGGYAHHMIVPEANLFARPEGLSETDAAALPLVFLTAWQMVVRKGGVQPGDVVLIHAAGSGVSSAAIQIAKLFGAKVFATTTSRDKADKARALGADEVILSKEEDFVKRVRELTQKRGVDLVIEHLGGDFLAKSILAVKRGGRIVTCGATTGFRTEIDLRHVFFRQIEILGSTMGSRGDLPRILSLAAEGRLRPVVDRVLPLDEARAAHVALEAGDVFGKIVLRPS